MLGEIYQLVNLHGLEIGMYLKSQYQCGCYLSAVCIDRSPLLFVGFSRSLLECIESCTYVTCELSLTRYTVPPLAATAAFGCNNTADTVSRTADSRSGVSSSATTAGVAV